MPTHPHAHTHAHTHSRTHTHAPPIVHGRAQAQRYNRGHRCIAIALRSTLVSRQPDVPVRELTVYPDRELCSLPALEQMSEALVELGRLSPHSSTSTLSDSATADVEDAAGSFLHGASETEDLSDTHSYSHHSQHYLLTSSSSSGLPSSSQTASLANRHAQHTSRSTTTLVDAADRYNEQDGLDAQPTPSDYHSIATSQRVGVHDHVPHRYQVPRTLEDALRSDYTYPPPPLSSSSPSSSSALRFAAYDDRTHDGLGNLRQAHSFRSRASRTRTVRRDPRHRAQAAHSVAMGVASGNEARARAQQNTGDDITPSTPHECDTASPTHGSDMDDDMRSNRRSERRSTEPTSNAFAKCDCKPRRPQPTQEEIALRAVAGASVEEQERVCRETTVSRALRITERPRQRKIARMKEMQDVKTYTDDTKQVLGCSHYSRKNKLFAKCCGVFVTCRLCHDEEMGDDHKMNRYEVEKVKCMECLTVQDVSEVCENKDCTVNRFATVVCKVCRLYDSSGTPVYHCDKCGMCRKGHKEDNFHCDTCDACVSRESKSRHVCMPRSLQGDCPICMEDLFTSRRPVVYMRCGHTMHGDCWEEYTKNKYTCPLCHKSLTDMTDYYQRLDQVLEAERSLMPPDLRAKRVQILCYDCDGKSETNYHYEHLRCSRIVDGKECGSYNTSTIS